jgi:hypothetical protein
MARGRAACAAGLIASVSLLVLAGAAHAASGGTYIVLDGPHAGTELHVSTSANDPAGFVPKRENKASDARGFIRPPNDHCPYSHFEGRIGGKRIKETDCLRVVLDTYSQTFLVEMSLAIKKEEKEKPNAADDHLAKAFDELQKAQQAGKVTQQAADEIEFGIKHAQKLDHRAAKELKEPDGDNKAEKLLERAINLKHDVVGQAPVELRLLQPPKLTPIAAQFQGAPAFQTVYTENATDPDGRRLSYTWSLVELNDPGCVSFDPTTPNSGQNQATWHHPDSQCNHALEGSNGHQGVVGVLVTDERFKCLAVYFGSTTGTGGPPGACEPLFPGGV